MTQEQFRNYQEQSFDAFCKKVIRNEAINIHKRLAALAEKEVSLSSLSRNELSAFCYDDTYHLYQKTYYVRGTPIRVYDPDLGEVLQFLSPQRREVILLYFFLDYSDADIARLLRISSPAVSARKAVALKKLKALLEGYHDS